MAVCAKSVGGPGDGRGGQVDNVTYRCHQRELRSWVGDIDGKVLDRPLLAPDGRARGPDAHVPAAVARGPASACRHEDDYLEASGSEVTSEWSDTEETEEVKLTFFFLVLCVYSDVKCLSTTIFCV